MTHELRHAFEYIKLALSHYTRNQIINMCIPSTKTGSRSGVFLLKHTHQYYTVRDLHILLSSPINIFKFNNFYCMRRIIRKNKFLQRLSQTRIHSKIDKRVQNDRQKCDMRCQTNQIGCSRILKCIELFPSETH